MSDKVAVIYQFFPHYRIPVIKELSRSSLLNFEFWGDIREFDGIKPFSGDDTVKVNFLSFSGCAAGYAISGYSPPLLDKSVKCLVILGNPNYFSTWLMAIFGRLLGKKIVFWTHGWLKNERYIKSKFRNMYFSLADLVFTYDQRSVQLAGNTGFDRSKVIPIYNSLDWDLARSIKDRFTERTVLDVRAGLGVEANIPLIICTARLTKLCAFDLLFFAANLLKEEGFHTNIVLVGDGPERDYLQKLSAQLDLKVIFLGAIYDEERIGSLIYSADITVSPGKVGLTAIHSLMYGTPVITHGNRDAQMPEVEALIPGVSGDFFEMGNSISLAYKIKTWLGSEKDRKLVREDCVSVIEDKYNPKNQREIIENSILKIINK